jgi:hypothetical protein
MTWISGFALLCLVYYGGADLLLVDPSLIDVSPTTAILISLASIGVGWVLYDLLQLLAAGQQPDHADASALCDRGGQRLGLYADIPRSRCLPASRRLHGDDHDGERLLRDHAEPAGRRR